MRNRFFDRLWIQVIRFQIDVDEDWFGAQASNATRGCEKGKAGNDDFIARLNIDAHESQKQRIAAGGTANRKFGFAKLCEGLFEQLAIGPANKLSGVENPPRLLQ